MKHLQSFLILLIVLNASHVLTENIVVFHHVASYSHRVASWPLAEALAARGHKVSYISPYYPKQPNPNITEYVPKELVKFVTGYIDAEFEINLRVTKAVSPLVKTVFPLAHDACEILLRTPEFHQFLKDNPKVDLIIIDNCMSECGIGVAQKVGAKHMVLSTVTALAYEYDAFGFAPESSAIPELEIWSPTVPFDFPTRISNALMSLNWRWHHYDYTKKIDTVLRNGLNMTDLPHVGDLLRNTSLILYTGDVVTDYPRSLPPLYVNVAGLHCKRTAKPLPKEMEDFIKTSKDGFIYISLGSMLVSSNLPQEIKDVFFSTIKAFPNMKFLWKWNGEFPKTIPDNLYLGKWFPQNDVLGHPKVKGFITQNGRPSTLEALGHGVPMISFPVVGDQDTLADRMQTMGASVKLEIGTVKFQEFRDAVQKVAYDESTQKRMKKLQKVFWDRPMSPVDTAVWWTEYVLRNEDTSHLRPAGSEQSWFVRRHIDVWGSLAVTAFIVLLITLKIVLKLVKMLTSTETGIGSGKKFKSS